MSKNLKTALIQADLVWEDVKKNRDHFKAQIEKLPEPVDLVVLPEMFSTGFTMNAAALAEPPGGATLEWMRKMALQKEIAITGSVITKEKELFFNRLYFVFPDGSFKKYDKRHTFTLAKENETYASGKERLVLSYKDWKICPLVCYDLRFPVWSRNTEEYDLLLYVANWPATRITAWDTLLKARAIENMSYCLGLNRVGTDGNGLEYIGHSAVYDSLGKKISQASSEEAFSEIIVLNKAHLQETRSQLRFLQDRDQFTLH